MLENFAEEFNSFYEIQLRTGNVTPHLYKSWVKYTKCISSIEWLISPKEYTKFVHTQINQIMNKKDPKYFIPKKKKQKKQKKQKKKQNKQTNPRMNMKEPKEFIQEIYIPCTLQLSLLVFMEMLTI